MHCCQYTLAAYPPASRVPHLKTGLHGIAPHRVYLVSLQHYLYILSVALFLTSRLVAINHYVALRCSDFPPLVLNLHALNSFQCFSTFFNKVLSYIDKIPKQVQQKSDKAIYLSTKVQF